MKTIRRVMILFVFTVSLLGTVTTTCAAARFTCEYIKKRKGVSYSDRLYGLTKKQKKKKWIFSSSDKSVVKVTRKGKYGYKVTTSKKKSGYAIIRAKQGETVIYTAIQVGKGTTTPSVKTVRWALRYEMNGGGTFDICQYNQKQFGELLCEEYPQFFGMFKTAYADQCSNNFNKIVSISQFYKDNGFKYGPIDSIEEMMRIKQGVCADYSYMTYCFCCVMGIPAEIVVSDILDHAWNQVYIDGRWLTIDTTGGGLSTVLNSTGTPEDAKVTGGYQTAETGYNRVVARSGYLVDIKGKQIDLNKVLWRLDTNMVNNKKMIAIVGFPTYTAATSEEQADYNNWYNEYKSMYYSIPCIML